jgi:signal transduction histidine kinase
MTGGIAHDFRNILAVIDSGLRLAQNNSHDPQLASTFIADAREGIARGLKLTSQLLSFAKQREFEVRPTDANELLKELELFLRYGAGPQVRVCLELASDIPDCQIDPSQFNAAILNLVINARDVMPNGGEIRISTSVRLAKGNNAESARYIRVRVKDEGTGMSKEVVRNIFEPFFTTKGEKGTGLGLPQVAASMRYVGGFVRVASVPGRGTTFDLFFPAIQQNSASLPVADPKPLPLLAGGPTHLDQRSKML